MVRRIVITLFSAAVIVLLSAPIVPAAKRTDEVVVSYLEGTAEAFAPGESRGVALKKNDRVKKDRDVRVGERSRIELRFPDGTLMRLAEKSTIRLNEAVYQKKSGSKKFGVMLGAGKLWAHVKKLVTPDSKVEVTTLNAVAGVRGTVYRVNVEEDKSALVKVYDGQVYVASPPREIPKPATEVSGPVPVPGPHEVPKPYHEVTMEEWHVIIKSMQQVTISPTGTASSPESFDAQADAQDDWVRWNQERDRALTF